MPTNLYIEAHNKSDTVAVHECLTNAQTRPIGNQFLKLESERVTVYFKDEKKRPTKEKNQR